jgi:hypothetical protein
MYKTISTPNIHYSPEVVRIIDVSNTKTEQFEDPLNLTWIY